MKLDFLSEKLDDILGFDGTKILVFSRYPEMLQLIDEYMGVPAVQYHGRMSAVSKAAAVNRFTNDKSCRLFLSSHAGAYGTDMRMASHLINYDLPWSAGRSDQINARHQRASSEFTKVFIRDMIMSGTIEVRKLAMLDYKRRIGAAVVDGVVPRSGRIENDLVSLTQFLLDN
jgi:SNF2 family DNA or RNA helicase